MVYRNPRDILTGVINRREARLNNGKTRSSLLGITGGYLMYLAYQLFQGRNDPDTTMTPAARIFFICFFVLAGLGVVIYAIRVWRHSDKEEEKPEEDQTTSLK